MIAKPFLSLMSPLFRRLIFLYPLGLVALPLVGLFLTATHALSNPEALASAFGPEAKSAYRTSLLGATLAARINGVGGLLVAWVLIRLDFPGKALLDAAVDLPFSLPTSVAGLTLLSIYNPESGTLGRWLAEHGIRVAFTPLAVLLARVFVSFPFVIRSVQPVLRELEPELEEAALSLGASPFEVFRLVVWPATKPAWLTGTALAFARAVGEFGSVVRLASNRVFYDLTGPVLVFQSLENYQTQSAALIGAVRLVLSLVRLVTINTLAVSKR